MIDTKELRSMVNGAQFESFANSVINALLDRLEAAEKDVTLKEQVIDSLATVVKRLDAQCDAMRARFELLERQEPVKHEFQGQDGVWYPFIDQRHYENTVNDGSWPIRALYTLPDAKGEEK